jgi:hypothetical protein
MRIVAVHDHADRRVLRKAEEPVRTAVFTVLRTASLGLSFVFGLGCATTSSSSHDASTAERKASKKAPLERAPFMPSLHDDPDLADKQILMLERLLESTDPSAPQYADLEFRLAREHLVLSVSSGVSPSEQRRQLTRARDLMLKLVDPPRLEHPSRLAEVWAEVFDANRRLDVSFPESHVRAVEALPEGLDGREAVMLLLAEDGDHL